MNPTLRDLAKRVMASYHDVSVPEYEDMSRVASRELEAEQRVAECLQVFFMEQEEKKQSIDDLLEESQEILKERRGWDS